MELKTGSEGTKKLTAGSKYVCLKYKDPRSKGVPIQKPGGLSQNCFLRDIPTT